MANRFRLNGKAYFEFITTPGIDPTNNVAEQAIRFVVIDRHVTQGTRSVKGRQSNERLWTVIATCSLQGRSAFNFILESVKAYFHDHPAPSLLDSSWQQSSRPESTCSILSMLSHSSQLTAHVPKLSLRFSCERSSIRSVEPVNGYNKTTRFNRAGTYGFHPLCIVLVRSIAVASTCWEWSTISLERNPAFIKTFRLTTNLCIIYIFYILYTLTWRG